MRRTRRARPNDRWIFTHQRSITAAELSTYGCTGPTYIDCDHCYHFARWHSLGVARTFFHQLARPVCEFRHV